MRSTLLCLMCTGACRIFWKFLEIFPLFYHFCSGVHVQKDQKQQLLYKELRQQQEQLWFYQNYKRPLRQNFLDGIATHGF